MSILNASKYGEGNTYDREIQTMSVPETKSVSITVNALSNGYVIQGLTTSLTQKEAYELAVNIIQSANACNQED